MPVAAAYGSLPFVEQIEFFRRKLNLPTDGWTDVRLHEHDWAFVVAGANRDAIVSDFRAAVEKAGGQVIAELAVQKAGCVSANGANDTKVRERGNAVQWQRLGLGHG